MLGSTDWKAMLGEVRRSVTWLWRAVLRNAACGACSHIDGTERVESRAQDPSWNTHRKAEPRRRKGVMTRFFLSA